MGTEIGIILLFSISFKFDLGVRTRFIHEDAHSSNANLRFGAIFIYTYHFID